MDQKLIESRFNEIEETLRLLKRTKINHQGNPCLRKAESFMLMTISTINNGKNVTPSEISKNLGVTMAAITHHLNPLEEEGYITRSFSKDDRRIVFINLTDKGEKFIGVSKKLHRQRVNGLIEYLGEADSAKLVELIRKIDNYLNQNATSYNEEKNA